MIGIMFFQGVMRTINLTLSYIYMLELMPKTSQVIVGTLYIILDASIFLFGTLWLWFVNNNTYHFFLIGYAI